MKMSDCIIHNGPGKFIGVHLTESQLGILRNYLRDNPLKQPKQLKNLDYLSVTQVARLLQVNRDSVLSWINTGRLRAINTSKGIRPRYRVARADLESLSKPVPEKKQTRQKIKTKKDYFPGY
jgi:excisionase family DNA binding protein